MNGVASHPEQSVAVIDQPTRSNGDEAWRDTSQTLLPKHGIFRILICRVTHSLGNTLLLTPLIRELQLNYPGAEIDLVTRSVVAREIFGSFTHVRTLISLPPHGVWHPLRYLASLRRMRSVHYDLAIDPCPRSLTGRALLMLAKARLKLGYATRRKPWGVTHGVPLATNMKHTAQRPVALLRAARGDDPSARFPVPSIELNPDERQLGLATLEALIGSRRNAKQPIVGLFANATGTKLLPAAWWRNFVDAFTACHPEVFIVEIVPAFGCSMLEHRYPAFYSTDIRRMAAILSELTLFISADCGVMHLAFASGTPVVGFFSVTDPAEWGPYGSLDHVLSTVNASPEQLAESITIPACR